ncbi:MAG TPA: creatininase family protein [Bryobacteraceae bacterium]|nr:creatininase family protein [Bryobacteraceae bacterium]
MSILSPVLGENTRAAFRASLADGSLKAAVLPVGATEQHNEHLAMHHDCRSVETIALRACRELFPAVVMCPTVAVGVSGHWMDHPGTLSLSPGTFTSVVFDVLDSLRSAGLYKVLIVNGHGGNRRPLLESLNDFNSRPGMHVECCSYWEAYPQDFIRVHVESGECPGHAAEFETSFALAEFPENVHFTAGPYPEAEIKIRDPRRAADDRRFFANARLATAEKGRLYVGEAVKYIVSRLHSLLQD